MHFNVWAWIFVCILIFGTVINIVKYVKEADTPGLLIYIILVVLFATDFYFGFIHV